MAQAGRRSAGNWSQFNLSSYPAGSPSAAGLVDSMASCFFSAKSLSKAVLFHPCTERQLGEMADAL